MFGALRLSLSTCLVVVPFFVFSDIYTNPNPDADPYNDLFDYAYGYTAPERNSVSTQTCGEKMSPQACAEQICEPFNSSTLSNGYGDVRSVESVTKESENQHIWTYKCNLKNINYFNFSVNATTYPTISLQVATLIETAHSCPPDAPNDDATVSAILGSALFCFRQDDLNDRDTCPDSTQDNAYLLPVNANNSAPQVCQQKSDGSICKYKLSLDGESYASDFENNCYDNTSIPSYDETGLTQPDPEGSDCQDIGGGVTACIENPLNVCANGVCQSGCGSVGVGNAEPVFVCLSGDTDLDGIPDYYDPDIDGDGIPNDDDLDSDGDGIDDPKYDVPGGTPVNVNMSGVEIRLDNVNGSLDDIATFVDEGNGLLLNIRDNTNHATDGTDENAASSDAFNKTAEELGGHTLTNEDADFLEGIVSKVTVSSCNNPTFDGHELFDFCGNAETTATFLEWMLWAALFWFLYDEFHSVFRRAA